MRIIMIQMKLLMNSFSNFVHSRYQGNLEISIKESDFI